MAKATTEFSALVPTAEYEFFKENFPQYGAVTWFINECLRLFNEQVREEPSSKEKIHQAIQAMRDMNQAITNFDKVVGGES